METKKMGNRDLKIMGGRRQSKMGSSGPRANIVFLFLYFCWQKNKDGSTFPAADLSWLI